MQHISETWSIYLNIVFAFRLIKIVIQGQLCQHLLKFVIYICSYFSNCKNYDMRIAILVISQDNYMYLFSHLH